MSAPLHALSWPVERGGEALRAAARAARLPFADGAAVPPVAAPDLATFERRLPRAASALGLTAEPVSAPYPDVAGLVRRAAPALLWWSDAGGARLVLLLRPGGRTVVVLAPDLTEHRVAVETLRATLCRDVEGLVDAGIRALLERVEVPAGRRERVRRALLDQQLEPLSVGPCWLIRPGPENTLFAELKRRGALRQTLLLAAGHGLYFAGWIVSWFWIGRAALAGRFDESALVAWLLILLSLIPLRLAVVWWEGMLGLGVGAAIRERLLEGVFRTRQDEVRTSGVGEHLGRVLEAETFEQLGLAGGFAVVLAGVELLGSAYVLSQGAAPWWQVTALAAWIALAVLFGWRYLRHAAAWADARVAMSQDLVERMLGHRTRLLQAPPERRHDGEDEVLDRYLERSRSLDAANARLAALLTRGWIVAGVCGLVPAFLRGTAAVPLAVGLGGVLLAHQALGRLSAGMSQLVAAWISWRVIRPLFAAARRRLPVGDATVSAAAPDARAPACDARHLRFRYPGGPEVLEDASLCIERGERVLLEGPSGSGKSTLAAVLLGLAPPTSGAILAGGMDRATLGEAAWRERVTAVPQFHQNHVFTGSLAFNLLMGRRWPASPEDVARAERLCRELGLGELIDRMPAGLQQPVGETGWRLSHGERNRVFVARALLQGGDLLILDESFAALDPETLGTAAGATLRHAGAVLLIAHP